MSSQRSVGRFCSVTTQDLLSLAALDAVNMGFGAQALVLSTGKSYRLLNSSFATLSPVTIRATDNSGTWFQEDADFDQAFFVFAAGASASVSVVQNIWHALPTGSGLYAQDAAAACWSVSTTTGIVTYNGPQAKFMARADLSLGVTAEVAKSWEFDLSRNGALIGTTSTLASSTKVDSSIIGALWCSYMFPVIITPPGTSYQMVLRTTDIGVPVSLLKYQFSFQLMP